MVSSNLAGPVVKLYQALQFLHWNRFGILLQIRIRRGQPIPLNT